jgi:hypothetical protein
MPYINTYTTRFRNAGVGDLYWKAVVEEEEDWPDGSGVLLEFDTGQSYYGSLQGPLAYDEEYSIVVKCIAVDGMKKASSPYTAKLTVYGYINPNLQGPPEAVIQTCKLIIFGGGILAFQIPAEFTLTTDISETDPVSATAYLGNVGDLPVGWELRPVLDNALEGNVSFSPSSGTLEVGGVVGIEMTLADPSQLEIGEYIGVVNAVDPNGWSDTTQAVVSVIIEEVFPEIFITGDLSWSYFIGSSPDTKQISVGNIAGVETTLSWGYEVTGDLAGKVTLDPVSGSLDGGDSETVDVNIDDTGLSAGTYTGTLKIYDTVEDEADVTPVYVPISAEIKFPDYLEITDRDFSHDTLGILVGKTRYNIGSKWYRNGNEQGHPRWDCPGGSTWIAWAQGSVCFVPGGPEWDFYEQGGEVRVYDKVYMEYPPANEIGHGRYRFWNTACSHYGGWIELTPGED